MGTLHYLFRTGDKVKVKQTQEEGLVLNEREYYVCGAKDYWKKEDIEEIFGIENIVYAHGDILVNGYKFERIRLFEILIGRRKHKVKRIDLIPA